MGCNIVCVGSSSEAIIGEVEKDKVDVTFFHLFISPSFVVGGNVEIARVVVLSASKS